MNEPENDTAKGRPATASYTEALARELAGAYADGRAIAALSRNATPYEKQKVFGFRPDHWIERAEEVQAALAAV